MLADILVLRQLQNFNIVSGMDWLVCYYAMIDYGDQLVTFCEPGNEEYAYRGCYIKGKIVNEL